MKAFFSAPQKINLGDSSNRYSISPTVLKNFLNKNGKIKYVAEEWKASEIILQIFVFVFDKTYHLVRRDSALVHPESAPSVHPGVHFFKVYFFVSCFLTVSLNIVKLKYRAMKLKTYEKFIWMIESGAIYPFGVKGNFLLHPESAHWVYHRSPILWCN